MSKKTKSPVWIVILVVAAILVVIAGTLIVKEKISGNVYPVVSFEIENYGTIKAELYPQYAPNTVSNIVALVESGYYNNKVIYGKDLICLYLGRDSEGNVINPTAGLIEEGISLGSNSDIEYTIPGEFVENGFKMNTLRHEKGVLSLIRNDYTQAVPSLIEESYNSGNAQIGIMMGDTSSNLNGVYAAFGKITEGLDILEKIYTKTELADPEVDEEGNVVPAAISKFKVFPVIKSATVETNGVDFGVPVYQEAFDYDSYMYDLINAQYGSN